MAAPPPGFLFRLYRYGDANNSLTASSRTRPHKSPHILGFQASHCNTIQFFTIRKESGKKSRPVPLLDRGFFPTCYGVARGKIWELVRFFATTFFCTRRGGSCNGTHNYYLLLLRFLYHRRRRRRRRRDGDRRKKTEVLRCRTMMTYQMDLRREREREAMQACLIDEQ